MQQNEPLVPDDQEMGDPIDAPVDDDADNQPELPEDPPGFHPRRSTRERRPSTRYPSSEYVTFTDGYVTLTDRGEPECYEEAMEGDDNKKWFDAMQDEMKSLHDNQTFELVKLPKGNKALQNR